MSHHAVEGKFGRMFDSIREVAFGLEDGLVSTMGAVAGIASAALIACVIGKVVGPFFGLTGV